mmetsp:Transcript_22790/g.47900  ORF Transcript_22790/g.47900 Transcript_22790/m.47900 type:complete len:241 (+) Transcript_22790:436-1158(+)
MRRLHGVRAAASSGGDVRARQPAGAGTPGRDPRPVGQIHALCQQEHRITRAHRLAAAAADAWRLRGRRQQLPMRAHAWSQRVPHRVALPHSARDSLHAHRGREQSDRRRPRDSALRGFGGGACAVVGDGGGGEVHVAGAHGAVCRARRAARRLGRWRCWLPHAGSCGECARHAILRHRAALLLSPRGCDACRRGEGCGADTADAPADAAADRATADDAAAAGRATSAASAATDGGQAKGT